MKPQDIVNIARETIGTKYLHQQRINGLAMDCAGVPLYVGKKIGVHIDDKTDYGRLPQPSKMREVLEACLIRVGKDEMQIGDVAWIRFHEHPQHFAIIGDYAEGGFSLIHAYNGSGINKVVEHRMCNQWSDRIVSVWRFPGVEN